MIASKAPMANATLTARSPDCPSMATSICLLLGTVNTSEPISPSPTLKESIKSPIARLLETRSLSIIRAFNERDIAAPYVLHATPNFLFLIESSHGTTTTMKKRQAMYWMRHVILKNIEHFAEAISSAVEVDEEKGHGLCGWACEYMIGLMAPCRVGRRRQWFIGREWMGMVGRGDGCGRDITACQLGCRFRAEAEVQWTDCSFSSSAAALLCLNFSLRLGTKPHDTSRPQQQAAAERG